MREIRGQPGSPSAQQFGAPNDPRPFLQAVGLARASAFIDSLIAQQDRHGGNARWDDANQKLGLIDHGYTFALPEHRLNAAWFVDWRWGDGSQNLDATEAEALNRLLASGDLVGLRAFMLPDRANRLEDRARRMLGSGEILGRGDY